VAHRRWWGGVVSVSLRGRDGVARTLDVRGSGTTWTIDDGTGRREVQILERDGHRLVFLLDGVVRRAHVRVAERDVRVVLDGHESVFARQAPSGASGSHAAEAHEPVLRAPVPGRVLKVAVEVGASVRAGDALVVIEAMKMETPIVAPADGTVTEVHATVGELVDQDQPVVTCSYEPSSQG
jgi:biotin carboxyl carrier protein